MLDLSTETKTRQFVDAALRLRREITSSSEELIRNYVGQDYRAGFCDADDNFENHAYEWCTNIVPTYASSNPVLSVNDMGIEDAETDLFMRVLRSLVTQTNPLRVIRSVALDLQFDFGAFIIDEEPTPGMRFPSQFTPMRPRIGRLSPRQYARDPDGPLHGHCRGEFHLLLKSRAKMLAAKWPDNSPRYLKDAVETAPPVGDLDDFRTDMLAEGWAFDDDDNDKLVVCEIYNRETNSWSCFSPDSGGSGAFLADEREYSGAGEGPYVLMEQQGVPDQVYPLAPLAITKRMVQELNMFRKAASTDAATAKRFTVIGGKSTEILEKARDAQSGAVLVAQGFNGQIATVDTGGVNPEIYKAIGVVREGVDRLSGLTQTIRGNLTGVTKGEADLAAASASARVEAGAQMFGEGIAEVYKRVLQLCAARKDMVFPIAFKNPEGRMVRATFYGGPGGGADSQEQAYPWMPSHTVTIEPYSMRYVDRARKREQLQAAQGHFLTIAAAMKQDPAIKGAKMIDDMFDTLDMPKTSDQYYDFQAAAAMLARGYAMDMQAKAAQAAGAARGGGRGGKVPSGAAR